MIPCDTNTLLNELLAHPNPNKNKEESQSGVNTGDSGLTITITAELTLDALADVVYLLISAGDVTCWTIRN